MFAKKASKDVDSFIISWFNNFIPTIVFTPLIFFIDMNFPPEFFIGVAGSGLINVAATLLYMRAIALGEISSVMPMLSFTPIFLLVTGPIMTGEFPNETGLIGVILVVLGSYLLNIDLKKRSLFGPFKALMKNKGTRYMFIVSFIWSLSANFDKISVSATSIWQHIVFVNLVIFVTLTIIVFVTGKYKKEGIRKARKNLLIVSLFTTGSFIFHMTALSLTYVAYVVSMKRMSGMFSVILGAVFFKEGNFRARLAGSFIMFAGVLTIVLS
ncbi:MAG: hypothetical protein SCALA702_37570 [Melioribacteraceae bacterium]|nr:MAG: hypothetical protein SCALA702_37570 [Melioribacteraceae bacterium]